MTMENQSGASAFWDDSSRANKKRIIVTNDDDNLSIDVETLVPESIDLVPTLLPILEHHSHEPLIYATFDECNQEDSGEGNGHDDGDDDDGDDGDDDDDDDGDDDDDDDGDDDDDDDDDQGEDVFININNFPVQMICLEKCEGTLDELLEQGNVSSKMGIAFMFQIVMTLLIYQNVFHMTHNDLHTNNIMYVSTSEEFLYYKFKNVKYKVPTYGYIFKIIDFGRSIYEIKGKRFCSDSFAPRGDGVTQYNCPPFMNINKPLVEPNQSFDICRLGCSIYDFILDSCAPIKAKKMTPFQNLINDWCKNDRGLNIMYKGKNGDERYPGFKLYKMIARQVHDKTPEMQLNRVCFKAFITRKKTSHACMDLDGLPQLF